MLAASVIAISVAIGLAPLAVKETSLKKVTVEFNSSVEVENSEIVNLTELGINAGGHLEFGRIEQNANYTKWIRVGVDRRSRVELTAEGNISELLNFEEVVYVKGQQRIPVELFPHRTGYHEGKIVLDVWRPTNRLGELYIDYWRWKDRNF